MDEQSLRDGLKRLAANHRWTWIHTCRELLRSLPGSGKGRHPYGVVDDLGADQIAALLSDDEIVSWVNRELADLDQALADPQKPEIAYCSPEYGITSVVPQYSGGLGVLAGDHLKAASDGRLPIVGLGLFYHEGFFRQTIDRDGQHEHYVNLDPAELGAEHTGHVISVPLPGRDVHAAIWKLMVGRVPLLLLDTKLEQNTEADRAITDRLYSGDRRHRLEQEMVLGVGGVRALSALGWDVPLYHLNEGHAGFITLELIDRIISDGDLHGAVEQLKPGLVFTTHTPVPAGIDRFHRELIEPYLALWADSWGVPTGDVWELGRDPIESDQFNMAALALRLCSTANGVSRLHGEVSRSLFAGVGKGDEITHITNGVHARTWVGAEAQVTFDEVAGPSWDQGDADAWGAISDMDVDRLSGLRRTGSLKLAAMVEESTGHELDPDALIIGFARRFAPYKRATLVLEDAGDLASLLDDHERPVHFLFAGKAHPMDVPGKEILARLVSYAEQRGKHGGFTFIPGYEMEIARTMVEGCDIWLNNPIRPREASGTSGQKSALNGGLNCSILDGWWAEMFDGDNGWAIPEGEEGHDRDQVESHSTLSMIREIVDIYYGDRDEFTRRIRHSWRTLGPKVTAARMLRDYEAEVYRVDG